MRDEEIERRLAVGIGEPPETGSSGGFAVLFPVVTGSKQFEEAGGVVEAAEGATAASAGVEEQKLVVVAAAELPMLLQELVKSTGW